ncbi:hypothetical protein Ndes2526A_g07587 [Nannochloris sp. 'desiccata']
MATLRPLEATEIEYDDEAGFFFRRLGEIALSTQSSLENKCAALCASRIAVASHSGVIIYCDSTAVYIVRSNDLLANLQKWNNSDEVLPSKNITSIGGVAVPVDGANIISLASDASIFAVGTAHDIHIYSTADVLENKGVDTPLRRDKLGIGTIVDISWRPQQQDSFQYEYAALVSGKVHLVNVSNGTVRQLENIPNNAACISWSPDGSIFAVGADDTVSLCDVQSNGAAVPMCTIQAISQDVLDESQSLLVEGLRWLPSNGTRGTTSLLVLSRLMEDEEFTNLAPCGIISWPRSTGSPCPTDASQITMAEFFAINLAAPEEFEESNFRFSAATDGNASQQHQAPPCLVSATVSGWGATVFTHMHAFDDHIKIVQQQVDLLQGIDVTDDKLAIRIPNAPGDANNYVVGLGFDLSSQGAGSIVVQHPTDETAPDLQPQPVLWVATSDGVLRAYSFGSTKERPNVVEGRVQPLPKAPTVVYNAAVGAKDNTSRDGSIAAAAAAALPESDSDFEEEEEEEEGEIEIVKAATKEPEPKPLFGFAAAVPTGAAAASPPAPGFSFAGPPPPSQPSSFSVGAVPASNNITSLSTSAASLSIFSNASAAPPSSVGSQPPLPSFGQMQQAQALKAKADAVTATPAPAAAAAAAAKAPSVETEEKSEEEEQKHRPARSHTAIISPAARLQDAGDEAATLERDFLKSLEETRILEASIHDAIADALRGADTGVGSHADFETLRQQVYTLQSDVTTASETLAGLRGEFEALALGVKEGYMRMEAMPAFKYNEKNRNSTRDGFSTTSELRHKQPLAPALGSLRDSARSHLRALSQKLDELKECVVALEDTHRQARTGEVSRQSQVASTPQAQAFALYEAINAQSAVIQAQTAKVDDLAASIKGSGIMLRIASLDLDALLLGGGTGSTDDFCNVLTFDDRMDEQQQQRQRGLVARRSSTGASSGTHYQSPASSPLVHIDPSKKSRVPWQSVRTSPGIVRRLSSTSSPALASPLSLSSPLHGGGICGAEYATSRGVAWKGNALARDILSRCKNLQGGIRVTEVSGMPSTPPLKLQSNIERGGGGGGGRKGVGKNVLPPLRPLVLPELPEPYMPEPKIAATRTTSGLLNSTSAGKTTSVAAAKPSVVKLNVHAAPAAPSLIPKPKPSMSTSSSSGSQQPPLPSFAQVEAAAALKANLRGSTKDDRPPSASDSSKPAKPKPAGGSTSSSSSGQPPLPSFGQLAAAQDLKAKAAAAQAAHARMAAFNAPAAPVADLKKEEEPEEKVEIKAAPATDGLNFGSFGFKSALPGTASTTSGATASASSSSIFESKPISFRAPAASTATSPLFGGASASSTAPAATSRPFGALSAPTPASAAASIFGAAASTSTSVPPLFGAASSSAAASSPFGAASTSGFGQSSAFGAAAAAATPAPASTPAVASPFGASSGFGAAAFGAPASPSGAFGAAAPSTGGAGGLFGAASSSPGVTSAGGAFGQPSAFGKPSGFGQPSVFGAAATPATASAFGQPSAFGQATSPAPTAFKQAAASPGASGGGFGSFATQPSGFSSFAQQSGAGAPAAPTGFGAMAGGGAPGGGFGVFGGGAAATPPKPAGGGNMWAPRK